MSNQRTRKYEQRKRAEDVADTRRRITEAAIELHGTLGPARTTMSAVAERAGVQRQTLYRHFPDEGALFDACSSHYAAAHPLPDQAGWAEIRDAKERLSTALTELYAYYEQTAQMTENLFRDADLVASIRPRMRPFFSYLEQGVQSLATGWPARGARRRVLLGAIRHAIDFRTWQTLVGEYEVPPADAVALASAMVERAAAPR